MRGALVFVILAALACGPGALPHTPDNRGTGVAYVMVGPDCDRYQQCAATKIDLAATPSTVLQAIPDGMTPDPRTEDVRVELRRHGGFHALDVRAMVAGRAPDEPLEARDVLLVTAARPRPAPSSPPALPAPAPPAPLSLADKTCGELLLRRARLSSEGKGEQHPEVLRTEAAREAVCAQTADVMGSLKDACEVARTRRASLLADGKGPRHPAVLGVDAELRLCPGDR